MNDSYGEGPDSLDKPLLPDVIQPFKSESDLFYGAADPVGVSQQFPLMKGKRRQGEDVYQRYCEHCGKTSKHPMHMFDGALQHFVFHRCDEEVPERPFAKFIVWVLLTPVLAYAMALYIVHAFFTELFFDHSFLRYAFSKSHHPLIKPSKKKLYAARVAFFLCGFITVLCLLVLPPFLWGLLIPVCIYLQGYALHTIRRQAKRGLLIERNRHTSELFVLDESRRGSLA